MFIRHLMKVEAAQLFENAITLYIDLGSQAALAANLKVFVLDEITRQLRETYDVNIRERNFVRGIYNLELQEDFAEAFTRTYATKLLYSIGRRSSSSSNRNSITKSNI